MSDKAPIFTQDQLDWLDKIFFENTTTPTDPYELYRRMGTRQVIQRIQAEIDNHKRRIPR